MEVWIFEVAEQCGERWEEDSKRIDVNPEGQWSWSQAVKGVARKRTVMTSAPASDKCFGCSTMYYAHYDSTVITAFEWPFTREIARAPTERPANH